MRRGPLLPGVENTHVASLSREFMRAVGNHAPEARPGPRHFGICAALVIAGVTLEVVGPRQSSPSHSTGTQASAGLRYVSR